MTTQLKKIKGEFTQRAAGEQDSDAALFEHAQKAYADASFGSQWNYHSTVFLKRQVLSRLLYQDMLYRQILDVPGVICEFGVHWGATMATLCNLRGIYEPYNHSRRICGFDTFSGFAGVEAQDGGFSAAGDYSTSSGYETQLDDVLTLHESFSPIPQLKKFELIKGDVCETLPDWLERNPHAIVACAIFDMDIYKPTRDAIELVKSRLTKGSLLVFDELNCPHFPGETAAVDEVLGLGTLRLRRFAHQPYCAWAVWGE